MINKNGKLPTARVPKSMKFTGMIFILVGILFFKDAFGLASAMNLTLDGTHKLVAGLFVFMGLLDIFVIPKILESRKPR